MHLKAISREFLNNSIHNTNKKITLLKSLPCGSPRNQYVNSGLYHHGHNAQCCHLVEMPAVIMSDMIQGIVTIWQIIKTSDLTKSHFPIHFFSAIQLFWNFAQSMAVILPCSVQNFKTIWALNQVNVCYDRDFVRINFRRVLDGFLILQWTHFLQWSAGQVWIDYYTVWWLWNSQGMRHGLLLDWNTYRSSAL